MLGGTPCGERQTLLVLKIPIVDDRWFVNQERLLSQPDGSVREMSWRTLPDPAALPLNAADEAAIKGAVHISQNEGAWWLVQLGPASVLAEYTSLTDPAGSLPAGPTARFSTATLDDTFNGILAVAQGGRSRCR